MIEKALTVRDVAREYGVQSKTVRVWIRSGTLAAIRLPGGEFRFRRHHLDEFDRCRATSSSNPATASPDAESAITSIGQRAAVPDAFQLGRQSARTRSDGETNG
jgi:excisionase family DNA binding protein